MGKQKRIAFFHEDDYCQTEILPLAAKNFCLKQMNEIDDFSQEHQLESGLFTDIFIRENTPHGIEELGLRPKQLNEALNFLPSYDLVETGYSSYREESEATFGRGNGYGQNFFWSINESGVVNAIWLDIEVAPITMDMWRKSLISLGETAPVLLADWNCSLCVDLTNSSDIEEYIKEKSRL